MITVNNAVFTTKKYFEKETKNTILENIQPKIEKIYDLAIHFDTKYHPVFIENEFKEERPVINANYNDLNLKYLQWTFDDTWVMTNLYKMVGKTLEEYIDEAPVDDLFRDACYVLDISETKDNLDKLREISKEVKISDKES